MATNKEKIDVSGEIPHFLKSLGVTELIAADCRLFYAYTKQNAWEVLTHNDIRKKAYEYATQHDLGDLTTFAKQMLEHLQIAYYQPKAFYAKQHYHLLRDGMVLDAKTATIIPNKKDYYLVNKLDVGYDPAASCPLFFDYLNTCFAGVSDKNERIAAIQEFAASMFLQDTIFQNFMLLQGVGGEGKSILLSALRSVIGRHFTSSLAITSLSDKFKIYSLKGKLANLSDESRANAKVDADMLKALTSGNPITVEQKGKEPEEMINYSKMIFAMNQFPMLGDSSRGMERRMIIISFPNPIAEEDRDIELERKITAERDGIFLWILEGLKRIIQTKKITVPPSSLEIVQTIMQSDPLTSFLNECLKLLPAESKPSEGTQKKVVYQAYVDYCEANGSLHSMTSYNFSRRMLEKGVISAKSNGNDYFKVKINAQVNQPKQGRRHIEETDDDLDNFL